MVFWAARVALTATVAVCVLTLVGRVMFRRL